MLVFMVEEHGEHGEIVIHGIGQKGDSLCTELAIRFLSFQMAFQVGGQ